MTSVIFSDVSRNYFENEIIILPMKNILAKFNTNVLNFYLIIANLNDPPQVKIHEKWQHFVKSKW